LIKQVKTQNEMKEEHSTLNQTGIVSYCFVESSKKHAKKINQTHVPLLKDHVFQFQKQKTTSKGVQTDEKSCFS